MAIDDNTLYGLTGAQVKQMVTRRGNTEISYETSEYGEDGKAVSLDSNNLSGHIRVGIDINNDASEANIYVDDMYPHINVPSTGYVSDAIDEVYQYIGGVIGQLGMVVLEYGVTTWATFRSCLTNNQVVFCKNGSRYAYMSYVANDNVEFVYYRSIRSHSDSQQGDQVIIYKLDNTNTWTTETRNATTKIVAGTNMTGTYSNNTLTLNAVQPTVPTDVSAFTNDAGYQTASDVATAIAGKADASSLATVATSGSYNDLSNKPTIPTVPTNVSAFTNDAGYQDASQVSSAIATAISGITGFSYEVVQTLPASGQAGTIYLIANSGTAPNVYDEYLWVNNNWEMIGTTEVDLSQYYTKTEVDTALAAKANTSTTYTKTEVDTALSAKADSSSLATVATSGSYADLSNKPTIPTVNNATLTIQKNGTTVSTFTANASSNVTANITVPVITMQTTDPGEGATLAANNFIAVYS